MMIRKQTMRLSVPRLPHRRQAVANAQYHLIVLGLVMLVGGWFSDRASAQTPIDRAQRGNKSTNPEAGKSELRKSSSDYDLLQGAWRLLTVESNGTKQPAKPRDRVVFDQKTVRLEVLSAVVNARFQLNPTKKPKTIDFLLDSGAMEAIYELDGSHLKIAYSLPGVKRPEAFRTKPGQKSEVLYLRSAQPGDKKDAADMEEAFNKALKHYKQREIRSAIAEMETATRLAEKTFGTDHWQTLVKSTLLAGLYETNGQFPKAETLLTRALKIAPDWSSDRKLEHILRDKLGFVCFQMNQFERAENYLKENLQTGMESAGPESADTLHHLGCLYTKWGKHVEGENLLKRSLELFEKHKGRDSPDAGRAYMSLGVNHTDMGRYRQAEVVFGRCLEICKKQKDFDAALLQATCLNNLGNLYLELGQFEKSLDHFQKALEIHERLNVDAPASASFWNNAGATLLRLHRFDDAEIAFRKSVTLREKASGKDDLPLVKPLRYLGILAVHKGDYAQAERLLSRSFKILKDHLPEHHPEATVVSLTLASVYSLQREFAKAERLHEQALKSTAASVGRSHRLYADCLVEQSKVFFDTDRTTQGFANLEKAMSIEGEYLRQVLTFTSEAGMEDYVATLRDSLELLVSEAAASPENRQAQEAATTWTLRRKAVIFDTLCRYREAQQLLSKDESIAKKFRQLQTLQQRLADLPTSFASGLGTTEFRKQMASLREDIEKLQAELSRALSQLEPLRGDRTEAVDLEKVRGAMAPDSALVEFLRISRGHVKVPHYYVLILLPDAKAPPRLIDLGPAADIDEAVEGFRQAFEDFPEKLRTCTSPAEAQELERTHEKKEIRPRAQALYRQLIEPIRKTLGNARLLFLGPEGNLNRLPFEALVDADGKYLIETFRFAYLSSGRDLLRAKAASAQGTVIFAGPDYKVRPDVRKANAEKLLGKKNLVVLRSLPGTELRSKGWGALRGAADEADDIAKSLSDSRYAPVKSYLGADALEEVLKTMKAPRILHLATHGFYKDRQTDATLHKGAGAGWALGRLGAADDPLLRSGIVLAGANTIGDDEGENSQVEDGWVTAGEIAFLNLRGTELVVLSACQTGLGDVKNGEGVYGLRRAFLYAGARTLVTSLFEVPDTETRELMRRFYTGLAKNEGKLAALHQAQRDVIQQRRQAAEAAHPFYWASFILVGDPD